MFEIVYMWADPQTPNGYMRVDSVHRAEQVLNAAKWVHMWGSSWARGDDLNSWRKGDPIPDLAYCDRALIADRHPYLPLRPEVSLHKAHR